MGFGGGSSSQGSQYDAQSQALYAQINQLMQQYGVPSLQQSQANQNTINGYLGSLEGKAGSAPISSLPAALQPQETDPSKIYTPQQMATLQGIGAMNAGQLANQAQGAISGSLAQRGLSNSSAGNTLPAQINLYKQNQLAGNNANILQSEIGQANQNKAINQGNLYNLYGLANQPSQALNYMPQLGSIAGQQANLGYDYQNMANQQNNSFWGGLGSLAMAPMTGGGSLLGNATKSWFK